MKRKICKEVFYYIIWRGKNYIDTLQINFIAPLSTNIYFLIKPTLRTRIVKQVFS